MSQSSFYLSEGLPAPVPEVDGLSAPYWEGLREEKIRIQKCNDCDTHLWGPEWICHGCRSFDLGWIEIEGKGRIYSWERVWHPVHPALREHGPYIVVLVELPAAGNIRMVGNLLGDPEQEVVIGSDVEAVFEHHAAADPAFTLLQWKCIGG
jgi:uncharacterized OB-fold protein